MDSRIRDKELQSKIMEPVKAVREFVPEDTTIGFGGMGGQSVPKSIPSAIAELTENEGKSFNLEVFTGGGGTPKFEANLSKANVSRRYYYLSGKFFRDKVNNGLVPLFDYWVGEYSRFVRNGTITGGRQLDVSVVEATAVDEGGKIIPSLSVDASAALIEASKKVIIEVNESKPILRGLHDIYLPQQGVPLQIKGILDRVGTPYISVPPSKIAAIVVNSEKEEAGGSYSAVTEKDVTIAQKISDFLESEYGKGTMSNRNPIQLGAGPVASAVMGKLSMNHLKVWSEIIPSKWASSLEEKVDSISASALYTLPGEEKHLEYIFENLDYIKDHIVLRPNEVTNNLEVILRLGVVAVQQAIEIDIFGRANISHIGGNIYNGVGGSGDFTRASKLVIIALPSTAAGDRFSRIVPVSSNVDIPKQDVDVVVTEFGTADLRGLSPRERAEKIISVCSHPKFKPLLEDYYQKAKRKGGNSPFDLEAAIEFQRSAGA